MPTTAIRAGVSSRSTVSGSLSSAGGNNRDLDSKFGIGKASLDDRPRGGGALRQPVNPYGVHFRKTKDIREPDRCIEKATPVAVGRDQERVDPLENIERLFADRGIWFTTRHLTCKKDQTSTRDRLAATLGRLISFDRHPIFPCLVLCRQSCAQPTT